MKIAVWLTGHLIADTVGSQIRYGLAKQLGRCDCYNTRDFKPIIIQDYNLHIGYGILRGMSNVFKTASHFNIPWINVDRGYWKPGHYDGYYRFSLNGTQQTNLNGLEPDYARLDMLALGMRPFKDNLFGPALVCPPTEYVKGFFDDIDGDKWFDRARHHLAQLGYSNIKVRTKDMSMKSADEDMLQSSLLYTFNCSLGWKGMALGIPCISAPAHSIVGAYQKKIDKMLCADYDKRRELFSLMSSLQLTLDEIRSGKIWGVIQQLLATSVTTVAKPLPLMSPNIQSKDTQAQTFISNI